MSELPILIFGTEEAAEAAMHLFPSQAVMLCPESEIGSDGAERLRGQGYTYVTAWAPNAKWAGKLHAALKKVGITLRVVETPKSWGPYWSPADKMPPGVGPADLQDLLDQAQPWEVQMVKRLGSLRWSAVRNLAIPKTVWHWGPFFPEVPLGLLVSLPGHGKSILMIQLAVAIATGLPLFGFPTGTPGSVVIVALEDSRTTLHKRLAAAVRSYGAELTEEHHQLLDDNLRILFRSENPLAYESPEAHDMALTGLMEEIIAEASTCVAPLKIIFVDTFNNVHGGDENSAQETRPIIAAIYAMHTRCKCAVWALHHIKKSGTARSAPPLIERMDPELSRGSGAILGAVRAMDQLGWIYPKEASKVGLDPNNSARRYAILGLTKINDGPPSPWLLLEHTDNAGLWAPVVDGDKKLEELVRGQEAAKALTQLEAVLIDLSLGIKDHQVLAVKHWPDLPLDDAREKLKQALTDMRRVKRGWVQPREMTLTAAGFLKAQALRMAQDIRTGEASTFVSNPDDEGANNDAA